MLPSFVRNLLLSSTPDGGSDCDADPAERATATPARGEADSSAARREVPEQHGRAREHGKCGSGCEGEE